MVKYTKKNRASNRQQYAQGFTMLEMMVVLAIAAILAVGTVPSLKDAIDRNGRESAMQNLITAISVARVEAVTQGRYVSICRSTNQSTCAASSGSDWDDGWIIFSDTGTAGTIDGTDALVRVYGASNDQSVIKLKTRANGNFTGDYLRFNSDGFLANSTTGAYFKFCPSTNVANKARAIWMSNTGRPTPSTAVATVVISGTRTDGTQKDLAGADLVCP